MKVFFIQKGFGLFASTGEYRANIAALKHLASLGHDTAQICFAQDRDVELCIKQMDEARKPANLCKRSLPLPTDEIDENGNPEIVEVAVNHFTNIDGIRMIAIDGESFRRVFEPKEFARETLNLIENEVMHPRMDAFIQFVNSHITHFEATHVLFSDSLSLKATATLPPGVFPRRIFVIHTAEQLPFGPYAGGLPDSAVSIKELSLLQELDGVWAVSKAIQDYAQKYGPLKTSFHVHDKWAYLNGETHGIPKGYHNWNKTIVGMINPSTVKGVDILMELAKAMPHVTFATWISWGFKPEIRAKLEQIPNIQLRQTTTNMEEVWSEIKILIVPSVWLEAWGMVVVEAQLRGIPVIASDAGALSESKLGVPGTVHVQPITGEHDKSGNYIVAKQDIGPWAAAVDAIMNDQELYESISEQGRTQTSEWLTNLDERDLESWLDTLLKGPSRMELKDRVEVRSFL